MNFSPMFQTTRRRLALWYTTVTAILLLVFASGFYGYVRITLIERIDDTIAHVVEVLERSLLNNNPLESSFSSAAESEADHIDNDAKVRAVAVRRSEFSVFSADLSHGLSQSC
jgi:two-component system, OmpR family, manganese sensing sensor histidine kinase